MKTSKSHLEAILEHLQSKGSITPMEALKLYGCFRLGARIWDLRSLGWKIETKRITKVVKPSKFGRLIGRGQRVVRYAEYKLN